MAFTEYTSPAVDAVTGVIAPAALWNTYVRDNLRLLGPHLLVDKPSDESSSSTTLQADDHLIAPVAANETWLLVYYFRIVTAAADMEFSWTFPAAATAFNLSYIGRDAAGTVTDFQNQSATSPVGIAAVFSPTSNAYGFLLGPITVEFVNGANAGNVGLQWAPNTAVNMTMKAKSTLWGVKL